MAAPNRAGFKNRSVWVNLFDDGTPPLSGSDHIVQKSFRTEVMPPNAIGAVDSFDWLQVSYVHQAPHVQKGPN